ncbi:MAG: hypothetical protein IJM21_09170 [Clostridia bacterium]|nr:hypothetical protein [Clostridia bacterium]
MALELSTAGIQVKYAVAADGLRPAAAYTVIPEIKSIPEFGTEVNTLQTTPLSAVKNHTYIPGLTDTGGAVSLTVNDCPAFRTAWNACVAAAEGMNDGAKMWFEYAIPGLDDSFYFPGMPLPLGFGGADVDEVLENVANVIPTGDCLWAAKSTVNG